MENINLISRYGDIHTLKHVEGNVYVPETNMYIRIIGDNPIKAIDFDGGPYLEVGTIVENKKISSIEKVGLLLFLILENA